jgi:glutamate-1-semialdehyde 2,1-aminomutase
MGNGFPIAAIGGNKETMASVGPGRTAHGGTYCGNAVGAAAACATLEMIAKGNALETVKARGKTLMTGIHGMLADADIPHHMTGVPAMFGIAMGEEAPTDHRTWDTMDAEMYESIMGHLVKRGAMPEVDGAEPWFLCAALSEQDVDDTLNYFDEAVKKVKAG